VETAIGVFASRDRAEEAVKELRQHGVPEQSIVFLTRSENEAKTIAKEFGTTLGGFVGGAACLAGLSLRLCFSPAASLFEIGPTGWATQPHARAIWRNYLR
jgi:hypothetical protein